MWQGLQDRPDWTWQQRKELYEDVPEKVEEFLVATKKKRHARGAREMLGLSWVMPCFHAECKQAMGRCGQLVIHLEVLHLVRDVMHATPNTESENRDIDGAVLRVRWVQLETLIEHLSDWQQIETLTFYTARKYLG